MTKIQQGRSLIRETAAYDRVDPVMVELHGTHLVVRVKNRPETRVEVGYLQLLRHGGKLPGSR